MTTQQFDQAKAEAFAQRPMRSVECCLVKLPLPEASGGRKVVLDPHSRHSSSGSLAAGMQERAS
jgi:hypothetical protein